MKNVSSTLLIACFLVVSCRRPAALYQPVPVETFAGRAVSAPVRPPVADTLPSAPSPAGAVPPTPELVATVQPLRGVEPATRVEQHLRHAATLLPGAAPEQGQPRPRPRARTGEKKTLRELLGLKPRPKLNWWQRIHWSLKASVPVILVAVVFALLNVTILAIIFGLLGAFLLIRGLKKEFKVRRPWF